MEVVCITIPTINFFASQQTPQTYLVLAYAAQTYSIPKKIYLLTEKLPKGGRLMNQQAKLYKFPNREAQQVHFVTGEEKLTMLRPKYLEPRPWYLGVVDLIATLIFLTIITAMVCVGFRYVIERIV